MKIQKMLSQNRRDFYADMLCEGCGKIEKDVSGYDDAYFHQNVIPGKLCNKCGESSNSLKIEVKPRETKYPEGLQL